MDYVEIRDIPKRVEEIRGVAGDDERAHGMEDQLWEDVLRTIADGHYDHHDDCRVAAEAALKTKDIDFVRWCA